MVRTLFFAAPVAIASSKAPQTNACAVRAANGHDRPAKLSCFEFEQHLLKLHLIRHTPAVYQRCIREIESRRRRIRVEPLETQSRSRGSPDRCAPFATRVLSN